MNLFFYSGLVRRLLFLPSIGSVWGRMIPSSHRYCLRTVGDGAVAWLFLKGNSMLVYPTTHLFQYHSQRSIAFRSLPLSVNRGITVIPFQRFAAAFFFFFVSLPSPLISSFPGE